MKRRSRDNTTEERKRMLKKRKKRKRRQRLLERKNRVDARLVAELKEEQSVWNDSGKCTPTFQESTMIGGVLFLKQRRIVKFGNQYACLNSER